MRNRSKLFLAGAAALGLAGAVVAAERNVHVLKVALPDGSIEEIHYTGDVAPKVVVAPAAMAGRAMLPIGYDRAGLADAAPADGADSPFAAIDGLFAAFDAQADAMLAHAAAMAAAAPAMGQDRATLAAAGGTAAPGSSAGGTGGNVVHYSFVSTTGGRDGGCVQSVEMTAFDGQAAPKTVSQRSGDCTGVRPLVPAALDAADAAPRPGPTPAAATKPAAPKPAVPPSKDAHII